MPRIVCLSDTHNCTNEIDVPDGEILIHSGDATITSMVEEVKRFNRWFAGLSHKNKIFVAGNHDWLFERNNELARSLLDRSIVYLQDSSVVIEGLKIYGSPWQPRFYDWAFNLMRGAEIGEKRRLIPNDVEVLITHGPPNKLLDSVPTQWGVDNAACEELRKRVENLATLGKLKLHVFGHIHCGYGTHEEFGVRFVNASICDEQYEPTQAPIVIDI